jgi:hypothetical protein
MKEFPTYFTSEHALSMNLRDYFAAKAMQAIIGKADDRSTTIEEIELWIGNYAYTVADAMIKERNK